MTESGRQMAEWTVYILRCADDSLYTGITTDIGRRLQQHNQDNRSGARYTRARRPVELAWFEAAADRSSASRREQAIKKLSRKNKLKLIGDLD